MASVVDSRDAWPFPAITIARATPDAWVEISAAAADQLLGAVPPIYIPGGFMVSEPAGNDERGVPIYCAVIRMALNRYLAREMPRDHAHGAAAAAYKAFHS